MKLIGFVLVFAIASLAAVPTWETLKNPVDGSLWADLNEVVVEKEWRLTGNSEIKADRVIIEAPIYTMGFEFQIYAKEIIFEEKGRIHAFPPSEPATAEKKIPPKITPDAKKGLPVGSNQFVTASMNRYYMGALAGFVPPTEQQNGMRIEKAKAEKLSAFLQAWDNRAEYAQYFVVYQSGVNPSPHQPSNFFDLEFFKSFASEPVVESWRLEIIGMYRTAMKERLPHIKLPSNDEIDLEKICFQSGQGMAIQSQYGLVNFCENAVSRLETLIFEYFVSEFWSDKLPKLNGVEDISARVRVWSRRNWIIPPGMQMRGAPGRQGDEGYRGQHGQQDPGKILLFAEVIVGDLNLNLQGQGGAKGGQGGEGQDGGDGGKGQNGRRGHLGGFFGGGSPPKPGGPGGRGGIGGLGGIGGNGGMPIDVEIIAGSIEDSEGEDYKASELPEHWKITSIGGKAGPVGNQGLAGLPGIQGPFGDGKTGFWGQKNDVSQKQRDELVRQQGRSSNAISRNTPVLAYNAKGQARKKAPPPGVRIHEDAIETIADEARIQRYFYPTDRPSGFHYRAFQNENRSGKDNKGIEGDRLYTSSPESLQQLRENFLQSAIEFQFNRNRWFLFFKSLEFIVQVRSDLEFAKFVQEASASTSAAELFFANAEVFRQVREAWQIHAGILQNELALIEKEIESGALVLDDQEVLEAQDFLEISLDIANAFVAIANSSSPHGDELGMAITDAIVSDLLRVRNAQMRQMEDLAVGMLDHCDALQDLMAQYADRVDEGGASRAEKLQHEFLVRFRIPACTDRPWVNSEDEVGVGAIVQLSQAFDFFMPSSDSLKHRTREPELGDLLPESLQDFFELSWVVSNTYAQDINESLRVILDNRRDPRLTMTVPLVTQWNMDSLLRDSVQLTELHPLNDKEMNSPERIKALLSTISLQRLAKLKEYVE